MTPSLGFEHGTHWWERGVFTIAPPLLCYNLLCLDLLCFDLSRTVAFSLAASWNEQLQLRIEDVEKGSQGRGGTGTEARAELSQRFNR